MNIPKPEDISRMRDRYGIPKNAKVLVTAGILNRGKNIESLIECLPTLEVKNVYLLVVGDGSTKADFRYRDSLRESTIKLGVDKRVIFTGWLEKEELWKMYLAADLFVLPSKSEGMPNAMLEALGLNLPCIGSKIPGIRDILKYDELMFDPMAEEAIAGKVRQAFSDDLFYDKVRNLCQERKKAFLFDWKEKAFQMLTERIVG
jgi:glycosyltransferase involved in cell wall biosynthesis